MMLSAPKAVVVEGREKCAILPITIPLIDVLVLKLASLSIKTVLGLLGFLSHHRDQTGTPVDVVELVGPVVRVVVSGTNEVVVEVGLSMHDALAP